MVMLVPRTQQTSSQSRPRALRHFSGTAQGTRHERKERR